MLTLRYFSPFRDVNKGYQNLIQIKRRHMMALRVQKDVSGGVQEHFPNKSVCLTLYAPCIILQSVYINQQDAQNSCD